MAAAQMAACMLLVAIISLFMEPDASAVWQNLWSAEMRYALRLSLLTGGLATLLVMLAALPIGYALSRFDFPFKDAVKAVLDLPIAFPELVLGLCLLLLFGNSAIGACFRALGLEFVFTRQGIVAAQFFTALPYASRVLKTTFDYVDKRLEFVSRSLGYSMWETFRHVSLPLAKKGILAATVISFARCIGAFGSVLILAGGSYMKTEVLPTALYLNISYGNMDRAVTSGIVLAVVSLIAIYFFQKAEVGI